jgi:hypothetical protein
MAVPLIPQAITRRSALKGTIAAAVGYALHPRARALVPLGTSSSSTGLQILTASLPAATVGSAYSATIAVTGGSGSGYSVYIAQATPNSSRWLQPTAALTLGGVPQAAETSRVTLVASDSAGNVSAPVTLPLTSSASGPLAFVTGAMLPGSTSGGIFAAPLLLQGGVPPYVHSSPNQRQPWAIDWDGWLLGAPTSTGSVSITDTVVDSAGNSASRSFTTTVGSSIGLAGLDGATNQINLPPGVSGAAYQYSFWPCGGSGRGYACSMTSGALAPGLALSSLKITGTPTRAGSFFATVKVTDSAGNTQSYAVCHQVAIADTATRPSYNTGSGFFVANGRLYDSTGKRAWLRGINRNFGGNTPPSWTNNAHGALTGACAVRVFEFGGGASGTVTACRREYLPRRSGNAMVPILTVPNEPRGAATSGSSASSVLANVMGEWQRWHSTLSAIDSQVIYNPANEWGPGSQSGAWAHAYQYVAASISGISGETVTVNSNAATNPFANTPFCLIANAGGITAAVLNVASTGGSQGAWTVTLTAAPTGTYTGGGTLYGGALGVMRGAGYLAPILIDAGGSGQDWQGLIDNAQRVQESDPQQNCIFAYHGYGSALNYQCNISSVTQGSTTVLTLDSNLPYHPFNPDYPLGSTNNYTTNDAYLIFGAQGMTQLNGLRLTNQNNVGGSQGAWTVKLEVNSSSWPAYMGGGVIVTQSDYRQILSRLAALRASNVCVGLFEFGPGNAQGSPLIAFEGYISGMTLTVTRMISGAILPNTIGTYQPGNYCYLRGASGARPAVATDTEILSQSSGTTGGVGTYTVSVSQATGSATDPVRLFIENPWQYVTPATGPSPTNTSIGQFISAAEANLMMWCYWSFDSHNIGTDQECSWMGFTGMTNIKLEFSAPSALTIAGMEMVFHPRWGLRTLASPVSAFLMREH